MTQDPWALCGCGHAWLRHDVDEYRGDGSEICCVEGCGQSGCPGHLHEGSHRWPSAGKALQAAFALFPDFSISISCEVDRPERDRTWLTVTRPEFIRLGERLGPELETIDQVYAFVRAESTAGDRLAEFEEWKASQGG